MTRAFVSVPLSGLLACACCGAALPAPTDGRDLTAEQIQRINAVLSLRHSDVQQLSVPETAGQPFRVPVILGGSGFVLDLAPYSIRSQDFKLYVRGESGIQEAPAPAPATYRGSVEGVQGSAVYASLIQGRLSAAIVLPDPAGQPEFWNIQPASDALPGAPRELHVVYANPDVIPGNFRCGADHRLEVPDTFAVAPGDNDGDGGISGTGLKVCDVAIDSDIELLVANGGSVDNTVFDIENVMNRVESIYERDVAITYEITTIVVSTVYANAAPHALLIEFQETWNLNMDDVRRDTAHLFTGKANSIIIGIAYLTVICNTGSAYGVSWTRFSTNLTLRSCLTAHELGHNWSAAHCDGDSDCYIMCSAINSCSGNCTRFGTRSINSITSHRNSRSCLNDLVDPQSLPFYDSFPGTGVNAARWSYNNRATTETNGIAEPTEPRSLMLNALSAGTHADDDVRTNFVLLGGQSDVTVSYHTQHVGVESGELLLVEYWNNALRWRELNRITSDGADQAGFQFSSHALPPDAFHNEFRIRIRPDVNETNDAWYVDDVLISGPLTLSVFSSPIDAIPITVAPPDRGSQADGATPFDRTYNGGYTITLTAPATHAGHAFDHWVIDGAAQPAGQTAVAVRMLADAAATAVYVQACDPCDVNCDSSINGFDIQVFVDTLGGNGGTPCSPCAADTNGDSSVNAFDIQGFVECLGG